ncbi:MAG: ABC transporter permease [Gammaproteobacteria bacterium]
MNAFIVLIIKDLKMLIRDRLALLLLVLAPIVVMTVAGFSLATLYRSERHVFPIANVDSGPIASELVKTLALSDELEIREVDRAEARRLVTDTPLAGAALIIPEGFSDAFQAGEPTKLILWSDPVKHLEVLKIRAAVERARGALVTIQVASRIAVVQVLTHASDADFEALFDDSSELASRLVDKSVTLEEESVFGGPTEFNSFDQNVPGFSVTFLLLGMLFGVGLGILDEREWGTADRMATSLVSPGHVATGKVISRFIVGALQMVLLFAFGWVAFGISLGQSLVALLLVMVGVAFAGAAFGLLAASLAPSREAVLPMGTMAVVAMAAVGGCWWPISIEPYWLQRVAHIFPTAWAMNAFNDLMLRGRGLGDVWVSIAALFGFGILYILCGRVCQRGRQTA